MALPALRYIDITAIEHEGEEKFLIRDPEGVCPDAMMIPAPMFFIATLFDGERDARAVQELLSRASGGQLVPLEIIEQTSQELDRCYLLANGRYEAERARLGAEFAALEARPASHAGASYPLDAGECKAMLDSFYEGIGASNGHALPRGMITPHIDLRVGGETYGETFARLSPEQPADLYVILGVAHQPTPQLYTFTTKHFETPLGRVETDAVAVERVAKAVSHDDWLAGEYVHKHEHSVEFQALLLRHRHGEQPFKILPVLCGSLQEAWADGDQMAIGDRFPEVTRFVQALRDLIDSYEGRVCVIAGVDLSHVGLKFGEPTGVDDTRAQLVETADRRMLAPALENAPERFIDHFREDQNARNVDAVHAVYAMLNILGECKGELVRYQQWREHETDSMVTFAGAVYR